MKTILEITEQFEKYINQAYEEGYKKGKHDGRHFLEGEIYRRKPFVGWRTFCSDTMPTKLNDPFIVRLIHYTGERCNDGYGWLYDEVKEVTITIDKLFDLANQEKEKK